MLKNATNRVEQILKATSHKSEAIQSTTSCETIPTNGRFCGSGRSSSGMDHVVSPHMRFSGNFEGCTKKKKLRNNRRECQEETEKLGFRIEIAGKGSGHFSIQVCIYVNGHRENSARFQHSYQKCWLICHCLHYSVSWLHVLESHSQLSTSESHF